LPRCSIPARERCTDRFSRETNDPEIGLSTSSSRRAPNAMMEEDLLRGMQRLNPQEASTRSVGRLRGSGKLKELGRMHSIPAPPVE
jgi:hypothetical protein